MSTLTGKEIFDKWFRDKDAFDDLEKAQFAYHEDLTTHQNGHHWPSGLFSHKVKVFTEGEGWGNAFPEMPDRIRFEHCIRCGRTRNDVRWDSLPAACASSIGWPTISDTLLKEEDAFYTLLNSAEAKIPQILAKKFNSELTAEALFYLQSTTGYPPDIVACFVEQDLEPLMQEYDRLQEEHKAKSGKFKMKEQNK